MFQSGPQIRTVREIGVFSNNFNEKRFTSFSRKSMNGTGTARLIVKRNSALFRQCKTCGAPSPDCHMADRQAAARRSATLLIESWTIGVGVTRAGLTVSNQGNK